MVGVSGQPILVQLKGCKVRLWAAIILTILLIAGVILYLGNRITDDCTSKNGRIIRVGEAILCVDDDGRIIDI